MSSRNGNNHGGRGHSRPSFNQSRSASASSTAFGGSHRLFAEGGTYEFALARPKIRERFIENECWSYVNPADPAAVGVAAAGAGIGGGAAPPHPALPLALLENLFGDPKPASNLDAANLQVAEDRLAAETMYDFNEVDIWDLEDDMEPEAVQAAILKNDAERRKEIYRIESSVHTVHRGLLLAVVQWDKDKALHEKKQASCLKVFNTSLGPGPLSVIHEELSNLRFRAAWVRLNDHFGLAGGGQQNTASIISLLNNSVYNPDRSLSQHIEEMILIGAELPAFGGGHMPDELMREYVLASVEKSGHADLIADCQHARRMDLTLVQTRNVFQITISKEATAKSVAKALKRKNKDHDSLVADAEFAAAAAGLHISKNKKFKYGGVPGGNGQLSKDYKCKHCGRNHLETVCWLTQTCMKCGQVGHIGRRCPNSSASEKTPTSTKTVSMGGVFAAKK
jgi:hypothetical protein